MVFIGQTRFLWIFAGKIIHRRQIFLGRARRIGLIHDAAQESKAVNSILFWEECDRISVRWAVPNLNNEKKAPWKRCSTGLLKINRGIIYFFSELYVREDYALQLKLQPLTQPNRVKILQQMTIIP